MARTYTPAEVAAWRTAAIAIAKAEILTAIVEGQIPASVRSFSELHDYCDANTLGGLCNEGEPIGDLAVPDHDADDDNASTAAWQFANAVQDAVHAWIASGAHEALINLDGGTNVAR